MIMMDPLCTVPCLRSGPSEMISDPLFRPHCSLVL